MLPQSQPCDCKDVGKGLSLKELASVVFPDGHRKSDILVLIKTFIDDSADEKQEKVVIAGAFMGRFGQWSELKRLWRNRLRREGIVYFRSTEYNSLRGEFEKYRDRIKYPKPLGSEAARQLRSDLEAIVKKIGLVGVAVCIEIADSGARRARFRN